MKILGKLLITISILAYTVIPPIVDLSTETHVLHDGWLPHARMHTVWLLGVTSGIGLLALYLLWSHGPDHKGQVNLSVFLSAIVFSAFYLSALTMPLYGGALTDMEGGVGQGPFGIDGNMFTFTVATALLLVGWILSSRGTKQQG
ncbi:MAG: hypothetical protein AAGG55_11145 [Pseudomonadota bacterium]